MLDFLRRKEEAISEVKKRYSCSHPHTRLTRYICSNGTFQFVYQCLDCKQKVGNPIKHSKLTRQQKRDAPPFDSNSREAHRDEISHQYKMAREKFNSNAWWQAYNAYLQSDEWQAKREQVFRRDKRLCTIKREWCTQKATEVHHLSYANVGNEPLEDLTSICHNCHDVITEESRRGWRVM